MITIPDALARSVLNDAPDAMVILDSFGTIWFANRRVSTLFRYAHAEIIGESIEKLLPERFRAHQPGISGRFVIELSAPPRGTVLDFFGQRRDGTEFPLEVTLSRMALS